MKRLLLIFLGFALGACVQPERQPFNEQDFQMGGPNAPEMNERTMAFMQPGNPYSNVEAFRPRTEEEKFASAEKWNTSKKITRWQEYKGTMVRVEILLGDSDIREMRLKLIPNASGGHVDGDMRTVLGRVADHEMRRVCGRGAETVAIVYEQAAFEVIRPTPFYDYRITTEGSAIREYGFRCIFNR
jgi:hypothetical protein